MKTQPLEIERIYRPDPEAQARAVTILVKALLEMEKEEIENSTTIRAPP
jgi:hypothetical protein